MADSILRANRGGEQTSYLSECRYHLGTLCFKHGGYPLSCAWFLPCVSLRLTQSIRTTKLHKFHETLGKKARTFGPGFLDQIKTKKVSFHHPQLPCPQSGKISQLKPLYPSHLTMLFPPMIMPENLNIQGPSLF